MNQCSYTKVSLISYHPNGPHDIHNGCFIFSSVSCFTYIIWNSYISSFQMALKTLKWHSNLFICCGNKLAKELYHLTVSLFWDALAYLDEFFFQIIKKKNNKHIELLCASVACIHFLPQRSLTMISCTDVECQKRPPIWQARWWRPAAG